MAVLGRSWALRVRSWAALGTYVGGPGLLLGPMLAVLAALGASVGGPEGSKAEKWPQTEPCDRCQGSPVPEAYGGHFSVDFRENSGKFLVDFR